MPAIWARNRIRRSSHTRFRNWPAAGCWPPNANSTSRLASPVATEGFDVDYVYTILRPYTIMLHKANPVQTGAQRHDRPVCPALFRGALYRPYASGLFEGRFDRGRSIRQFAQLIFSQDKPILENQLPKRLPLNPRAEIPIRADAASAAYRTWLRDCGCPLRRDPGMTTEIHCTDRVALDQWHIRGRAGGPAGRHSAGKTQAARHRSGRGTGMADGEVSVQRWRHIAHAGAGRSSAMSGRRWESPAHELFDVPEYDEADRRNMNGASVGLHVSAPRAVENFLDLGPFCVRPHRLIWVSSRIPRSNPTRSRCRPTGA